MEDLFMNTNKIDLIKAEVARIQLYTQSEVLKQVLDYIDEVQKEPVSEDLEKAAKDYVTKEAVKDIGGDWTTVDILNAFNAGAKWQKEKDESKTEDLGEYINELSKQFPEVSFAKLSRIAVRVAKWQEQQFEKNRLAACDRQTEEEAEIEQSFVMGIIENEHRQPTFDDAIKYGMRLREQQMMAKAVDVEVKMDAGGYPYIPQMELYDYDKDEPLAKEGDKYKVVFKED